MITDARIIVLALLVLAVLGVIKWPKHAWRWHSGHTLDGYHHTNATWIRPATKVLHPTGNAVRWHKLPRLMRLFVRTGFTFVMLLAAVAFLYAPWPFLITLAVLGVTGAVFGGRWAWRKVRPWLR
jgi:hypothetical protein